MSDTHNVSHVDAHSSNDLIDIRELFLAFRRRIGLFLAFFILVFGLTAVVTFQATPLYTTAASVIVDPQEGEVTDFETVLSGRPPDSTLVDTEVEIIKSRALIERVVKKLGLTEDPEFNPSLVEFEGLSLVSQNTKSFISSLIPQRSNQRPSEELKERLELETVVNNVLNNLSVRRSGLTYIIQVGFTSETPRKAALIANEIADQYLVEQLEGKFEATSRSNDWLDERLSDLREEVRIAEQVVEVYRAQSGLLSAQGSSLTEQQISDLNSQLVIQKADYDGALASLNSVKTQIERGAGAETIGEVLSSDVIRDLRRQQSEIAGRRAELLSRYGERHPEVRNVERETIDVNSQIQQEVQRIVLSLERDVNIARQKVQSIEAGLSQLRGELTSNNQAFVRLRELERDASATRTLYESFLGRFKETGEQGTITEADARVISMASLPIEKSSPNTMLNLLLGTVLGGLLGVAMVALAEMLDRGYSTGDQVEKTLNVPFISAIPLIGDTLTGKIKKITNTALSEPDYLVEKPLSSFAESFRTLRSSILLGNVDKAPKIVMITSALPGDGKTISSHCLGRISAMSGSKTLIIDCDLRRRSLSKSLERQIDNGLIQVLNGDLGLSEALIRDDKTGCYYLPLAKSKFTPKDIFGSQAFRALLEELRGVYDMVILDTAPILPVAETRAIANVVDGVVLAIRWRRTTKGATGTATKILKSSNANIIGVVLTQVNMSLRKRYGDGDYGYYYGSYKGYYVD